MRDATFSAAMTARARIFIQAAVLSALVGGTTAALVMTCGERDDASKTTTTAYTPPAPSVAETTPENPPPAPELEVTADVADAAAPEPRPSPPIEVEAGVRPGVALPEPGLEMEDASVGEGDAGEPTSPEGTYVGETTPTAEADAGPEAPLDEDAGYPPIAEGDAGAPTDDAGAPTVYIPVPIFIFFFLR